MTQNYKKHSTHSFKVERQAHDGRGIALLDGKTTFIEGALPGEQVDAKLTKIKNNFNEAVVEQVISAANDRIEPKCQHFSVCGGCSLQHMDSQSQLIFKQAVLQEQFQHFAGLQPQSWLAPITGPDFGYRYKARLGVRYVNAKARVLVGFREKHSHYIADIASCQTLHPKIGELIQPLAQLIADLSIYSQIPQIEVAMGDDELVLIFRHLQPVSDEDAAKLMDFAKKHKLNIYLQPKGPDTVKALYSNLAEDYLCYRLADSKLEFYFAPSDFTQVNPYINQKMVKQALELLELDANDRVLDLFCGLGNFSLAMARQAQHVVGVEGSKAMVERAYYNAKVNALENVAFYDFDLNDMEKPAAWKAENYHKILLDPPRSGAQAVVENIESFAARRILYVSCNPATLARDAGILAEKGYELTKAGVMDMFPQTTHVESMALFNKK